MTRARLTFPEGDPIEFSLEDVVAFGPEIHGFRAWLGAVFASADGRWIIRIGEDEVLGFRRDELKRVRATPVGAELTLGGDEAVPIREADVTSYGPEPQGIRAWLGRLAHGHGDAWIRAPLRARGRPARPAARADRHPAGGWDPPASSLRWAWR